MLADPYNCFKGAFYWPFSFSFCFPAMEVDENQQNYCLQTQRETLQSKRGGFRKHRGGAPDGRLRSRAAYEASIGFLSDGSSDLELLDSARGLITGATMSHRECSQPPEANC